MTQALFMEFGEIDKRYSKLAESDCCLSCGGALNYSNIRPGEVCVDLGSGRGTDVMRMAETTGSQGFVYGIDISDGMLNKARTTAEKLGITNVNFVKSPLENLSLPAGVADLVVSNCTINHSTDKQAVWNEIYRILKKGGRFIISDIYATTQIPEKYRTDPVALAECWAGSVTKDEYLQHLLNSGFQEITILEESKPYEKGEAEVCSFTIAGKKPAGCSCGCNQESS
jgi:arsenite methyltransferase